MAFYLQFFVNALKCLKHVLGLSTFHSSEQNSIKFVNLASKNAVHTCIALYWESPSEIAIYCISMNVY